MPTEVIASVVLALKQPVLYIRPPAALKVLLEETARENGRTLNQEVIRRLRQSFDGYRNESYRR